MLNGQVLRHLLGREQNGRVFRRRQLRRRYYGTFHCGHKSFTDQRRAFPTVVYSTSPHDRTGFFPPSLGNDSWVASVGNRQQKWGVQVRVYYGWLTYKQLHRPSSLQNQTLHAVDGCQQPSFALPTTRKSCWSFRSQGLKISRFSAFLENPRINICLSTGIALRRSRAVVRDVGEGTS